VNDDSEGTSEVFDMLGIMYITALEMLHEIGFIGTTSPLPDNFGLLTLFFLDFMVNVASDFELEWVHEIVRATETYGVALIPSDKVEGIDQKVLDNFRKICKKRKKAARLSWKTEVCWCLLRTVIAELSANVHGTVSEV
jgi:hypothetical protein